MVKVIRLWPWFLWLGVFYSAWLMLVWLGDHWSTVADHWPIALAMAIGSYVAGSTPMGGGTVGFPVLVLAFDMPATLGRDFSFAVQAIGMTSASFFILARRQPLALSMLQGAGIGTLVGLPVGIFLVAPYLPDLWIKVVFAVIWAGFGLLHLYRAREFAAQTGMLEFDERWDFRVGLLVGGVAGLLVVSATGVGVDMMVYAALVLLCRADLKIAIPTSVVIMAFASVYGLLWKLPTTGLQPGVFEHWLAAAPVVALGAPLGVLIVNKVGRLPTLLFVAVLCVGQFAWTCINEYAQLGVTGVVLALVLVGLLVWAFERLHQWGAVIAGERGRGQHHNSLGIKDVEPHLHSPELP